MFPRGLDRSNPAPSGTETSSGAPLTDFQARIEGREN